jgi:plasmid maintenance system antidote protein VapI
VTIDPFGDKYLELPPTITILGECNISKATFFRTIAKFQALEMFDFQDKGFTFRNLSNSGKSHPRDKSITHETAGITHETAGITHETASIYSELQNKQTLSEAEKKVETFEIPNATSPTFSQITEIENHSSVNTIAVFEEKFSAAPKNLQQRNFNWLPDGPWNLEGKLDPDFRDFVAKDWLKRFGGDIHSKRADVLSHFKKDPANLPIRWEQYQSEYLNRYENTQTLLNNGVEIPEDYQDRLIANQRAITAQLPQELNPVLQPQPAIAALPSSTPDLSLSKVSQVIKNEEGQSYKLFRAADLEITPEQAKANREFLADAIANTFSKKYLKEIPKTLPLIEQLNLWINDPILRETAINQVNKNSDRFECLFDGDGIPYQVIEVQPTEEYDF